MKLLLFAGAGTSVELGVPAMVGMGSEFVDHAKQWGVEPELVERLIGDSHDVEHLIESLDQICTARGPLAAIGQDTMALDRIDKIRAEVEWFVQHVAERVVVREARLMWGPILRAAASLKLTLVTTNYDRAIELAANAENIEIDDGFGPFDQGELAPWTGFSTIGERPVLVKLHGSTDWYAAGQFGHATKLRHPMPLFGRATLRLADGSELGSALVLPSREKLLTRSPYPWLSHAFLEAVKDSELAIFVGSSLHDHHIRDAAEVAARRVPTFAVNPSGDAFGVPKMVGVRQCASTFLIATLPQVLAQPDRANALLRNATEHQADAKGVLVSVRQALDADIATTLRCRALEELDDLSLTLDSSLLRRLLADDSAMVARYTLGLISLSTDCRELVDEAARSQHASDPAFGDDLQLLREMRKIANGQTSGAGRSQPRE